MTMQETWQAAMVDGLRNIRSPFATTLALECAFYGHEYNDGKSYDGPEYTGADLEPGLETDLVIAIGAAAQDNEVEDGSKLYLPGLLQRALVVIQRSALFEGRDAVLVSFVKQVSRYLNDADFRSLVHDEVAEAMARSPRLVIGHSFGSVIAYDWLRRNEVESPPALITLGSPLGLEAIRRRLERSADRSRWPGGTRSWTNIAAHHDAVAMVKKLAALYHPDIEDLPCDNPRASAHSALEYLGNVQVSRAINKALA
jgi:hypothetical protein